MAPRSDATRPGVTLRRSPSRGTPGTGPRARPADRRPTTVLGRRRDAGTVTAETAVLLPVLVVVLAAAVFVLACVAAQLRCVDAARSAARVAARGEAPAAVIRTAERLAPPDARVAVAAGGGLGDASTVEVVVRAQVRPFGGALRVVPAVRVSARAVAAVEPGAR